MSGLGIALLSGHTVHDELASGRLVLVPSPGIPIIRQWFMVWRADQQPIEAARTVADWIVAQGPGLFPTLNLRRPA